MFIRKVFRTTVISVSEALRNNYMIRGHPSEHITTIHNGIDLSNFRLSTDFSKRTKRAEFGIPPDAPVVVSVGVLREGKGHYILVEAAKLVLDRFPR
jgi:glycosyltransferase involved in cell wall biosynthesis